MPPGVFVLVLVVAVLHVAWNALLKTSGDTLRTAERAMVVGVAVFAPFVLVGWLSSAGRASRQTVVPLADRSGFLEAAYFVCLAEAYRRGDLSVVYPIARGTAPSSRSRSASASSVSGSRRPGRSGSSPS